MSRLLFAALVLLLSALIASPARADDEPHPVVAAVKPQLKDPKKPFAMLVMVNVKEGAGAKFEAAFAKAVKGSRKEKGCIAYDLNQDPKKPTSYMVYERWQNLAALEGHMKTEHITALLKELGDLLEAPPEVRVLFPAGE